MKTNTKPKTLPGEARLAEEEGGQWHVVVVEMVVDIVAEVAEWDVVATAELVAIV
jgi:hypothetical protein